MLHKETISSRDVRRFSRMVLAAVRCGVPLDDILNETKSFHGEYFAGLVESKMREFL